MKARVVIGSNWGDCGKGLVTDWLCATQGAGIVVRFNGGSQAGHTVVTPEGERHVFRHVGSGTFCGVPTYLSSYFVCNPILFMFERDQLIKLGFHPEVYAHPDCLITTYADMFINQDKERRRGTKRHGSCGVGFHETIQRSTVPHLRITMSDLWNGAPQLESQMAEICDKYASFRIGAKIDDTFAIEEFLACCKHFAQEVEPLGIAQCKDPVFEGAQGLLLDQDNKEFFPHVTHSHTGMKNVEALCAQAGITDKDIYYVSRTYLTRHGYGPLPGEDHNLKYDDDTNHPTEFQGPLRFAPMDYSSLLHRCRKDAGTEDFNLVFTHCDQCAVGTDVGTHYSNGPTRDHVSVKLLEPEVLPA